MKLQYRRPHTPGLLNDQLLQALPGLVSTNPATGRRETRLYLESQGDDLWVTVPDTTDPAAVAAVINAHVADANYGRDQLFEWAVSTYRAAWTNKLSADPPVALTAAETTRFQRATTILMRRAFRELAG